MLKILLGAGLVIALVGYGIVDTSTVERAGNTVKNTVYILDDDTTYLIESALNCMITLADAQVDEASKDNLELIADEIANRFGINSYKVVETVHTSDDGEEEVIYSPLDGLGLGDDTGRVNDHLYYRQGYYYTVRGSSQHSTNNY